MLVSVGVQIAHFKKGQRDTHQHEHSATVCSVGMASDALVALHGVSPWFGAVGEGSVRRNDNNK